MACSGGALRVAAGSSHSIAWAAAKMPPTPNPQPVTYAKTRDPLGAHSLGLYEAEEAAAAKESQKNTKEIPSLAQQVLALEPLGSRQHALSLLLNAAHILQVFTVSKAIIFFFLIKLF